MSVRISLARQHVSHCFLFFGIIFLFCLVSFFAASAVFTAGDQIFPGVVIADIPVGGLSKQAARHKFETLLQERLAQYPPTLIGETQSFVLHPEDIQLQFDAAEVINQSYAAGRTGDWLTQLIERYEILNYGRSIPLKLSFDEDQLTNFMKRLSQTVNVDSRNAVLVKDGGKMAVLPEVIGKRVALDENIAAIKNELKLHATFKLPLIVETVLPDVAAADLNGLDHLLATFTTQFSPDEAGRSSNILIAAGHLKGMLLRPNAIFSFNTSVGARLAEADYQEAPSFIDGKLVPDVGGGVCQVSTTLYNAALLADMTILERSTHFSPPDYVPLGQDATVADHLLDLRFQNTLAHPVYIVSDVTDNQLTISFYSVQDPGAPDIQIIAADKNVLEPADDIIQDTALDLGTEIVENNGQQGYQVTTYRIKSKDGREISRELLATDEFVPSNRTVRIGTRVPENS